MDANPTIVKYLIQMPSLRMDVKDNYGLVNRLQFFQNLILVIIN